MKRVRNQVRVEALESRELFAIDQVGGIGYLPSDNGTRVQRYDVGAQQWLAPITLPNSPGGATATLVDADGIYVAYGRTVMRYALDGSTPTHLMNAPDPVHDIHSDGRLLFLNHSAGLYARFISIDKTNNAIIDAAENYVDSVFGSSISTTANRIFGRSQGISPADITYMAYDDTGNLTTGGDSPYHGDYPSASNTWVFPLGTKVVDNSGGVYATSDLTRLHSFGTAIDDITFVGNDVPVVLRGNTLTAYSTAILPTGSKALARPANQILTNGSNVIAFNPDANNANRYDTQVVPLSDLKAPEPGQPVNPVGLPYTPDDVEVTADGNLLILDIQTQSIFRWDAGRQQYGATIPLVDVPKYMAYSAENNAVYLAYASGLINRIDLGAATPNETPFAALPSTPLGLSTAGRHVFAVDGSGAWVSHYTFAPDGTQISAVDWNYYSTEYIWSPANSKMYFFRDDTSPNDLLSEPIAADGKIGAYKDSPLHTSSGFTHPLRVSPDGRTVILGSGMVHDGETLARQTGGLSNTVSDIAWLNGAVYTVRLIAGYTQFQQWTGSTFAPGAVTQTQGTPLRLLNVGDAKLVGIYLPPTGGVPQFRVMDGNLQPLSVAPPWVTPPGAATWNPATKVLNVTGAASITADPGADAPIVTAGGAAAVLTINTPAGGHVTLGGLKLSNNARAGINPSGAERVLVIGDGANFTLDPTATLDLTDNALVVRNPTAAAASAEHAAVQGLVRSAFNNFAWDGKGITSSTAAADVAGGIPATLGTLLNSDGAGGALFYGAGTTQPTFMGVTVDAHSLMVRATQLGDGDLNRTTDTVDFSLFQAGYSGTAPYVGFAFGDYDYNGVIDTVDFGLFQAGYQSGGGSSDVGEDDDDEASLALVGSALAR